MYHKLVFPTRTNWDMSISAPRHIEIILCYSGICRGCFSNGHFYSYGFAISYLKPKFISEWLYIIDDRKKHGVILMVLLNRHTTKI